jgi:hypothetical protein
MRRRASCESGDDYVDDLCTVNLRCGAEFRDGIDLLLLGIHTWWITYFKLSLVLDTPGGFNDWRLDRRELKSAKAMFLGEKASPCVDLRILVMSSLRVRYAKQLKCKSKLLFM